MKMQQLMSGHSQKWKNFAKATVLAAGLATIGIEKNAIADNIPQNMNQNTICKESSPTGYPSYIGLVLAIAIGHAIASRMNNRRLKRQIFEELERRGVLKDKIE